MVSRKQTGRKQTGRKQTDRKQTDRKPAAHIVVQNLPVPFDRRVWLECQSLVAAGWDVSVVCPKGPGDPPYEMLDGVALYKYDPPKTGSGKAAFVREYASSFAHTARLTAKAWRSHRFDVLQACNPPDIFWPLALLLRLAGVRFVFDHHDLCPELYESKFGTTRTLWYRALRFLEWCTFRSAHRVTSTNESYRAVAIDRGGKAPADVTVVRTGPDPDRLTAGAADPALRRGRNHLAVYIGVMGPQDGVDLAVRAAGAIVAGGRTDISFTYIGSGESYEELVSLVAELGLSDYVSLPGRLPDTAVMALMSSADVGLCPDPKNPLNDVSTMNKTMEYMAFGLPVVAFDLVETRLSAGDAALYARPNEVDDFAKLILALIDDPGLAAEMGAWGRTRVVDSLAWSHQAARYVAVYHSLVGAS